MIHYYNKYIETPLITPLLAFGWDKYHPPLPSLVIYFNLSLLLTDQHPDNTEIGSPSHDNHTELDERVSTKRPKWWEKLIGDVRDEEIVEGQSSRDKSKQNTINFAFMDNIQGVYEP